MKLLKDKIIAEGVAKGTEIVKVDRFLNHQVDPFLLKEIGKEFYDRFKNENITKILTIESSGIAIAAFVALEFGVPFVFAKKYSSRNLDNDVYQADVYSFTKCTTSTIRVSKNYINADDRVLIIDDFLANGCALKGLIDVIKQGGAEVCGKLSEMMQWEEQAVVPKVAYIACCGDNSPASRKHDYRGINTCIAAYSHFAGYAKCAQSCLGIGDCAEVCPNHAICIENGIATVRPQLCEGCGLCAKVCPSRKIRIIPKAVKVIVRCTSNDKGANTRKACDSGCIGCKKCEKVCENDAIHVINNCAEIDYSKCTGCGKCAEACISGCITTVDFLTMSNMPFSSV